MQAGEARAMRAGELRGMRTGGARGMRAGDLRGMRVPSRTLVRVRVGVRSVDERGIKDLASRTSIICMDLEASSHQGIQSSRHPVGQYHVHRSLESAKPTQSSSRLHLPEQYSTVRLEQQRVRDSRS